MVVFGIGAGLRPGELAALRAAATSAGAAARSWFVSARAPGGWCQSPRAMPHGQPDWPASCGGFVFRPGPADRGYKNFVNGFAGSLVAGPAAPRLSMSRARSAFICDHLAAGTPVGVLLAISGIAEAGSLARYARHVSGISSSKGALRARWRAER